MIISIKQTSKKRRAELNNLQESSSEDEEEHSLEVGVTYKSTSTGKNVGFIVIKSIIMLQEIVLGHEIWELLRDPK